MDKEDVAYIQICTHTVEYYSAINSESFAIYSNMDRSGGYYSKWNKSDRERQMLYDITYMWNLKKKTSEYNEKPKQTQIQRTPVVTSGETEQGRGSIGVEVQTIGYKISYMVIQGGEYKQYFIITINGV